MVSLESGTKVLTRAAVIARLTWGRIHPQVHSRRQWEDSGHLLLSSLSWASQPGCPTSWVLALTRASNPGDKAASEVGVRLFCSLISEVTSLLPFYPSPHSVSGDPQGYKYQQVKPTGDIFSGYAPQPPWKTVLSSLSGSLNFGILQD